MAVIEVGRSSSHCSECHRDCFWEEGGHLTLAGYGPQNGQPGCGAKWTGVAFVYSIRGEDPRLEDTIGWYPEWMRNLPLV
jgi:hypothetical protein